ncbi:hypothetical protein GW937_01355 [Candidatus Kaiserbacteria bacterium]|nr:hypothetical protein [Candidatus Kaiserbacteria bacterium]
MEQEKIVTPPEPPRLIEILKDLDTNIKKQNSLKYAFLKGIFYGLGTMISATVLVALLGGVIVKVLNTFSDTPLNSEDLQTVFTR